MIDPKIAAEMAAFEAAARKQSGLPRGKDITRPRNAFNIVMIEGFERLTASLRRGDPFSPEALDDMLALRRRYHAFAQALEGRLQAHDMSELLEDPE